MDELPVIVVGAGPAGLTAAITLARAGIETLVLERRERPSRTARANTLSTATMELMRSWGLEPAVREGGIDVEMRPWVSETLGTAAAGRPFDAGFPSREQSTLISPTAPACVPQSHLEPVLEQHLRSIGPAEVRRGAEVCAVAPDAGGVTVTVRGPGGDRRRIRGRYLIAADGIRSSVREAAGIGLSRREDVGERLAVQFTAPLWDLVGDIRQAIYVITGAPRAPFFIPAGRGDRWVFGTDWDSARDRIEEMTPERLAGLIRVAAGDPGLQPRIGWSGIVPYGVHLADRFRAGRVLLVGDAAHRVTPRGATGLNSAVRDGHDVGWKLSWVLRDWAEDALLDTYEAERRPVAEHNVARSSRPDGSEADVVAETRRDLAGRLPHVWLPGETGRVSTLDLLGEGLTLLAGPDGVAWRPAARLAGARVPLAVRTLDPSTLQALGIAPRGALLLRPDGRPAAQWSGEELAAEALRAAVGSATAARLPVAA